jgi:hypothetical protein
MLYQQPHYIEEGLLNSFIATVNVPSSSSEGSAYWQCVLPEVILLKN